MQKLCLRVRHASVYALTGDARAVGSARPYPGPRQANSSSHLEEDRAKTGSESDQFVGFWCRSTWIHSCHRVVLPAGSTCSCERGLSRRSNPSQPDFWQYDYLAELWTEPRPLHGGRHGCPYAILAGPGGTTNRLRSIHP